MKRLKNSRDGSWIKAISHNQNYFVVTNDASIWIYETETFKVIFKQRLSYVWHIYFTKDDELCIIVSASANIMKVDMRTFEVKKINKVHTMPTKGFLQSDCLVYFELFYKRGISNVRMIQYNYQNDEIKKGDIYIGRVISHPYFHTEEMIWTLYTPLVETSKTLIKYQFEKRGEITLVSKEPCKEKDNALNIKSSRSKIYKFVCKSEKIIIYKNEKLYYEINDVNECVVGEKDDYILIIKKVHKKPVFGYLFNLETLEYEKEFGPFYKDASAWFLLDKKRVVLFSTFQKSEEKDSMDVFLPYEVHVIHY